MSELTCYDCGMAFAVPDTWEGQRRKDHKVFWCPNGHSQSFRGPNEAEKKARDVEAELVRERNQRASAESSYEYHRERGNRLDRRLAATKGVVTKLRRKYEPEED